MSVKEAAFWQSMDEYHDLVEQFERGITYTYPDRVTSKRMCPCLDYCNWCGFPLNGKVEYVEYRGENI